MRVTPADFEQRIGVAFFAVAKKNLAPVLAQTKAGAREHAYQRRERGPSSEREAMYERGQSPARQAAVVSALAPMAGQVLVLRRSQSCSPMIGPRPVPSFAGGDFTGTEDYHVAQYS